MRGGQCSGKIVVLESFPNGLATLAMDRGATEPGRSLTWRGSDLFYAQEDSSLSLAA